MTSPHDTDLTSTDWHDGTGRDGTPYTVHHRTPPYTTVHHTPSVHQRRSGRVYRPGNQGNRSYLLGGGGVEREGGAMLFWRWPSQRALFFCLSLFLCSTMYVTRPNREVVVRPCHVFYPKNNTMMYSTYSLCHHYSILLFFVTWLTTSQAVTTVTTHTTYYVSHSQSLLTGNHKQHFCDAARHDTNAHRTLLESLGIPILTQFVAVES